MGCCWYSELATLCAFPPQLYLRKASISRQTLAGGASSPAEATVDQLFLFKRDPNLFHWVQLLSLKRRQCGKEVSERRYTGHRGTGEPLESPHDLFLDTYLHRYSQVKGLYFLFHCWGEVYFYFFKSISCILWHDWRCSWTSNPLSLLLRCYHHRCAPTCLVCLLLGSKLRSLFMLHKRSTNRATFPT